MLPTIGKVERRGEDREQLEIKSLEDARKFVKIVGGRNADNNSRVKAWQIAKQAAWLFLVAAAFLVFYLVDSIYQAISLP